MPVFATARCVTHYFVGSLSGPDVGRPQTCLRVRVKTQALAASETFMADAPAGKHMMETGTSGQTGATKPTASSLSPRLPEQRLQATHRLKIAVGIATADRPSILLKTLDRLARQVRRADAIFVCAPTLSDAGAADEKYGGIVVLLGPRGLPQQRNAILDRADGYDVVVFLDDDFVPAPQFLDAVERLHVGSPEVALATGEVLSDGIHGPGLNFSDADRIIEDDAKQWRPSPTPIEVRNGYGCNMSVRLSALRPLRLRFDEYLPLYAWLEDVDFGVRVSRYGTVVKSSAMRGVHLGVKIGRQSGRRLGYSQIANPVYLINKGSLGLARALYLMSRNIAANFAGLLRAEPWIDRRGRLAGNLIAFRHLFRGRLDPRRALEL